MTTSLNSSAAVRDRGEQLVHYLRRDFTYADAGLVLTVGAIPAGSQILNLISGVFVSTAFNFGTNNRIDIGTTANDDLYGTDMSLASVAFVALDESASATDVNAFYVSSDTTITATPDLTGTAGTAGVGRIIIAYIPNR